MQSTRPASGVSPVTPTLEPTTAAQKAKAEKRLAELPDVVYIEHLGGAVMLDGMEEIEIFSRALDRLTVDAETPDRSRQLLAKAIAEL